MKKTILLVEDQKDWQREISAGLKAAGYNVVIHDKASDAVDYIKNYDQPLDGVVTDGLEGMWNDVYMACQNRSAAGPCPCVVVSSDKDIRGEALQSGITNLSFVDKGNYEIADVISLLFPPQVRQERA